MDIPGVNRVRELNNGMPDGWRYAWPVSTKIQWTEPSAAKVYAIISTWFDGDIIAANVRNCFANGCERVFVLDNDSPDNSVQAAVDAGAEVAEVYSTQFYDDDYRIRLQNAFIHRTVEQESLDDLWFLCLDADEFVTGLQGEPLLETLRRLPEEIRTVGNMAIDLYPETPDAYVIGEHPAKCMTRGMFRQAGRGVFCLEGCWKHVALRFRNGFPDVAQVRGNHTLSTPTGTIHSKPEWFLWLFHAPFRREQEMRVRLEALCGKKAELGHHHRSVGDDQVTGGQGAVKRWRSLDAVYSQDWKNVEHPHSQIYGRTVHGITLYDWVRIAPDLYPLWSQWVSDVA